MKTHYLIIMTGIAIISVIANVMQYDAYSREQDPCEYQFTITDDSLSVYDYNRYVGTVKIEGQLKQLINKDNE